MLLSLHQVTLFYPTEITISSTLHLVFIIMAQQLEERELLFSIRLQSKLSLATANDLCTHLSNKQSEEKQEGIAMLETASMIGLRCTLGRRIDERHLPRN